MNLIRILNIKMFQNSDISRESEITRHLLEGNGLITFVNLYSYMILRKDIALLDSFKYIFSDGIILTKLLNIFKIAQVKRFSFDMTSLASHFFKQAEVKKMKVYLVGGNKIQNYQALKQICNKYPNLLIVRNTSGYFQNLKEEEEETNRIVIMNPEILIIGLGAGLQEKFLFKLNQLGWHGLGITCGAFISQTSLKLYYYPKIMNNMNLRWLFRIYKEPKLLYRYFVLYPIAILYFFFDIIRFKINIHKKDLT